MKDKIIYLIIGILTGAIITAGCFMVFSKNTKQGRPEGFDKGQMGNMVRGDRAMDSNQIGAPTSTEGINSTSNNSI